MASDNTASTEWKKRNKDRYNKAVQRRSRHVRMEVMLAYGDHCVCCGEWRYEFLAFDHVDGGGYKHRQEVPAIRAMAPWLKRNDLPEGFRILCHNCNAAHGFYGYCPHEEERGGF